MPRKKIDHTKLLHLAFYWVKRARTPGSESYPDWQPMLWDKTVNRFFTDKVSAAVRIGDLQEVGERCVRETIPRTKRNVWVPLDYDYATRRLMPDLEHISTERATARRACASDIEVPIRATISWSREAHNHLSALERASRGRVR